VTVIRELLRLFVRHRALRAASFVFLTWMMLRHVSAGAAQRRAVSPTNAAHSDIGLSPAVADLVHTGIHDLYNLNLDKAETAFTLVAALASNHPAGCVYLAMSVVGREVTAGETADTKARFRAYTDMAVARALRHAGSENDPWKQFYAGAAFLLRARWEGRRQNYIEALKWLKRGLSLINRARDNPATAADARAVLGAYQYFASHLPWYCRFFATLLIEPADKREGLDNLEFAARHARVARPEARMLLAAAYVWEHDPDSALELTASLLREYPLNYCLGVLRQDILIRNRNYSEAHARATNELSQIESDPRAHVHGLLTDQHYGLGVIQFGLTNYHSALTHFATAYRLGGNKPHVQAWAMLRQGTLYDLMGKRKSARECYAVVRAIDHDSEVLNNYSEIFSERPYQGETLE